MQVSKPKIPAYTSLRIFLILYIINGHFIQVATQDLNWLHLFKQHNTIVGCFFVLSGYLLTYAYSPMHAPLENPLSIKKFMLARLVRMYPLYFCILLIFSPMFMYVDLYYGGPVELLKNIGSVFTLTQSIFPNRGLSWNSPTWFLSSLLILCILFALILHRISRWNSKDLWKNLLILTFVGVVCRIAYNFYTGYWTIIEELHFKRAPMIFNFFRFNPLFNLFDFFTGALAARLYMVEPIDLGRNKKYYSRTGNLALIGLIGMTIIRIKIPINDLLIRNIYYTPLFTLLLMSLHRVPTFWLNRLLNNKFLVYLGNLSFALYIVHGAVGQLFYKKLITAKLFSSPPSFFTYYFTIFLVAIPLYHLVEVKLGSWIKNKILVSKTKSA